jgi:hypothetical protein
MGRIKAPHPSSVLGAKSDAESSGGISLQTLRVQTNVRILLQLLSSSDKMLSRKHSKKQLTRRISSWGLGKNVKHRERQTIIEELRSELEVTAVGFETRELRGRKLDTAKLKRWMREERAVTVSSGHEAKEASISENCNSKSSDAHYERASLTMILLMAA